MKEIIIDGRKIEPGEKVQINALIARLPTRTPINIPVFVARAKVDGPTLLVMAVATARPARVVVRLPARHRCQWPG